MAANLQVNSAHLSEAALRTAAERSYEYLRTADDRKVAPSTVALQALEGFHESFPEASSQPANVVAQLDKLGSPATVITTGGRYFGYVIGATLPASLAASWLVSTWDQNAGLRVMSPVAAELEEIVLRWVCEVL